MVFAHMLCHSNTELEDVKFIEPSVHCHVLQVPIQNIQRILSWYYSLAAPWYGAAETGPCQVQVIIELIDKLFTLPLCFHRIVFSVLRVVLVVESSCIYMVSRFALCMIFEVQAR